MAPICRSSTCVLLFWPKDQDGRVDLAMPPSLLSGSEPATSQQPSGVSCFVLGDAGLPSGWGDLPCIEPLSGLGLEDSERELHCTVDPVGDWGSKVRLSGN